MRYEIKKSFDRSTKRLPEDDRIEIKKVIFEVLDVLATGKKPLKGIRFAITQRLLGSRHIFKGTDSIQTHG